MSKNKIDPDASGCALVIFAFFLGIALIIVVHKI